MSILAIKDEEFYEGMGVYFVALTQSTGFSDVLKALGRNLRDMLLNLDNLHEYLRTTFPRIKPPSFFIEEESEAREFRRKFGKIRYFTFHKNIIFNYDKIYYSRYEASVS